MTSSAGRASPGFTGTHSLSFRSTVSLPFARFAGIVDGVTEAHFRYDQEAAEQIMGLEPAAARGT